MASGYLLKLRVRRRLVRERQLFLDTTDASDDGDQGEEEPEGDD